MILVFTKLGGRKFTYKGCLPSNGTATDRCDKADLGENLSGKYCHCSTDLCNKGKEQKSTYDLIFTTLIGLLTAWIVNN
jgi:hypothetical protein